MQNLTVGFTKTMLQVFVITTLSLPLCVKAQTGDMVSLSGSIGFSGLGGSDTIGSNFSRQLAFAVGSRYSHVFNQNYSLETGLDYVRGGAKVLGVKAFDNNGNLLGDAEVFERLHHIQIPLMVKFYRRFSDKGVYLGLGPAFSLLVDQSRVYPVQYGLSRVSVRTFEMYKQIDLGLVGGVGFFQEFGIKTSIFVEANISRGLIDVILTNTIPIPQQDRQTTAFNQRIEVRFGVSRYINVIYPDVY